MENLTHSLVGATLAELALPVDATPGQRRLFYFTGVIAANLPDADLVYTSITAPPLGYLLHHRGHTHTIVGLVAQALLIGVIFAIPLIRRVCGGAYQRFAALVGITLLSHVVLDSWNSYGVHPFWPLNSSWFYGDAISIFEPWLWMILGISAALNTRRDLGRLSLFVLCGVLVVALALFRMIPFEAAVALAVFATGWAMLLRRKAAWHRAGMALAGVTLFVASSFVLSTLARSRTDGSLVASGSGSVVDIVLTPQPANPLCFNALGILKSESEGRIILRRGTSCITRQAQWEGDVVLSLARLRSMAKENCSVRAWLQFGRAPWFDENEIADHRFGRGGRAGFTTMQIPPSGSACPANLTNWEPPRADLL